MDEDVVLVDEIREFRDPRRDKSRHASSKVVGQEGFKYSSNRSSQEWLKSIMGSGRTNAVAESQTPNTLFHKVPDMLRNTKDFKACYEPQVVSIGPYHNPNTKLNKQEMLKSIVLRQFLKISDYREGFLDKFAGQIGKVEEYYDKDSTKDVSVEKFTQMMFMDGCFILYFIYCVVTYGVKNLEMENQTIALVQQDLFLLENQIPFQVLMVLMSLSDSIPIESFMLNAFVDLNAIGMFTWTKDKQIEGAEPLHLLDLLWKKLIGRPSKNVETHSQSDQQPQKVITKGHLFRNVKELKTVGIHLRPNKTGSLSNVNFTSYGIFGNLTLPRITIDSSTKAIFLNLMAHEACMDKFAKFEDKPRELWVTSYLCFLGLLIYHADDVTELRTAGILSNFLGSDAEVATLINEIAGDSDFDNYGDVKLQIQDYFRHRRKTKVASWVAEVLLNYFKSPWTIIGVVAGFIAISLTVVQTYFAIHPVSSG